MLKIVPQRGRDAPATPAFWSGQPAHRRGESSAADTGLGGRPTSAGTNETLLPMARSFSPVRSDHK